MESSTPEPVEESSSAAAASGVVESTDLEPGGEILEKLKGDRIGETMYSERFVLSTVLKLPQLETPLAEDEDFEKDLCSLWDMTIEADVVLFLLKHDVVELLIGLAEGSEDHRLVEILLGILMRIFTTILDKSDDEAFCWFKVIREQEDITEKLAFILSSTTSSELIQHTLEAVHAMVNRFTEAEVDYAQLNEFYKMFAKPCLIEGLMEGFKQIYPESGAVSQFEEEYLTSKDLKIIQKFLEIHENFIINANEVYADKIEAIVYCVHRILIPLSSDGSLLPISKAHVRILVCINSIYSAIVYHFHAGTFLALVKIYTILAKVQEQTGAKISEPMDADADDDDAGSDGEFDIQTALGETLETLYFMAEPIDGLTISNALRASSLNEQIIAKLCTALRETMAGDPLLGRTCDLLLESARQVWGQPERGRS
ncbi:hypothetical protein quinque_008056 [Culex quinquefasciatus]